MYARLRFSRQSTYDKCNAIWKFFFLYVYRTFWRGLKQNGLRVEDIDGCPRVEDSGDLTNRLIRNWTGGSLLWVLFRTFAGECSVALLLLLYEECLVRLAQPLLLGAMIRYLTAMAANDPVPPFSSVQIWLITGGVCLCTYLYIATHHIALFQFMRLGLRARTATCGLLYRKVLRLSPAAVRSRASVGHIVNLMSNDVNRFDELGNYLGYLIATPLQSLIIVYLLWSYLGVAAFAGVALLLLFMPFQALMGRLFSWIRIATAKRTDIRLRYMNEIIAGIRVIKMYCWERPFSNKITNSRKAEISKVRQSLLLKAINLSIFYVFTRLVLFVCLVTFVLISEEPLNAETVFVSMSMFNIMRTVLTYMFPMAISLTSELAVSCKRIEKILLFEENPNQDKTERNSKTSNPAVKLQNLTAHWSNEIKAIENVTFDLKPGDLLTVIGPVGSGKTSLLMCLLEELLPHSGSMTLRGSLSYASQQAWSINDTVRNNILFGSEYNESKYGQVIQVCALQRDLHLLPFGDQTLVGEKGSGLSGGQKARLNLARALYRDADIVLLDDPLSAVDAPVAKHIFEKCILEHLKDKITILVTHQIQYIKKATKVLLLNDSKVLAYGTYQDIKEKEIHFTHLFADNNERHKTGSMVEVDEKDMQMDVQNVRKAEEKISKVLKNEELSQHGSISWKVYCDYITAGKSYFLLVLIFVFTVVSQAFMNGSDIYLSYWTNKNQVQPLTTEGSQMNEVLIYSCLILALFLTTIIRSFSFFALCIRASSNIHTNVFGKLFKAPMSFFDLNPTGRILNRFSKDLGIVDETLPTRAYDMTLNLTQTIGVIVTVSLVNWYLTLPALVTVILMITIRVIYGKSAFDIKRLEGQARSPIYSHVSNSIDGLTSIRAFGVQSAFVNQFNLLQNDHTATWFLYISCSRSIDLVLSYIATIYIAIITISTMLIPGIQSGDAGLAISTGILFTSLTQWTMRHTIEFENQMTSVERLQEYSHLPQETNSKDELVTTQQWPSCGEIVYENYSLMYRLEDGPVLRNISCKINGGEKIGIVGRTGAGKSSMITALFRLAEACSGRILIDGFDIAKVNLGIIRSKISIIPQEPIIFTGTVRDNLDPNHEYPDVDIWKALEKAQLRSLFGSKLETALTENGSNLSVGQRQLLCLARALLRGNRILILDEATASVDHQTDQLIQTTIRSEFRHCTVLTIAHRLHTVIDCDRIMVMDAGQVVEFETPYALIADTYSVFYEMCRKTGQEMFHHLRQSAKTKTTDSS